MKAGMHRLSLLAFFLIFISTSSSAATNCLTLLKELLGQIPESGLVHYPTSVNPTVSVVKLENGVHGGKKVVIKRTKDGWNSQYNTVGFDPQGDPRTFVETLGGDVAEYFGFKIIDDHFMSVPDANEFNGALAQLNRELKHQGESESAFSFYSVKDENNVSVSAYVKRFVEERGLPVAASGNHFIHDISFHTSAIVIPEEMVAYKVEKILFENAFFDHLKKKYEKDPETLKGINFVHYLKNFQNTVDVDEASAATRVLFEGNGGTKWSVDMRHEYGRQSAEKLIGKESMSPKRDFREFLMESLEHPDYVLDEVSPVQLEKLKGFEKGVGKTRLFQELNEFSRSYRSNRPSFDVNKKFMEKNIGAYFCEKTSENRLKFRKVVQEMKASGPQR